MSNPKTTITGYLVLAGAVFYAIAHCAAAWHGVPGAVCLGSADAAALTMGLAGIGLIAAKDGGH